MIRICIPRFFLACTITWFAPGCASRPVHVPTGQWRGCGTFVLERWAPPEKAASLHRDYHTRLNICPSQWEGKPAVNIEILSEHGGMPGIPEEKTHLRMLLVEVKRPSDSIALFQVGGMEPNSDKPPEFDDKSPIGATLIRSREAIVLQIAYDRGFVDTFRFKGDGLTKSGSLTDKDELIHWVESLYRVQPVDLMSSRAPFR